MDVLWALQWFHDVKVGYIDCHELGFFCRDYAVEENFFDKHICCGCGYFTWVVYLVSAYSESASVLIFLLGSYTAHKLPVFYIFSAIVWYFLSCDERDCVSRVILFV